MFEIGDIVSVRTTLMDGFPHGRNAIGGVFPVNRSLYEVIADMGNGIYVIGVGNLAIAAVPAGELRLSSASSAWEETDVSGKARIRHGARNYMGYPLPSYVYEQQYRVSNVLFDRVLLENENQVVAVKAEDLI